MFRGTATQPGKRAEGRSADRYLTFMPVADLPEYRNSGPPHVSISQDREI